MLDSEDKKHTLSVEMRAVVKKAGTYRENRILKVIMKPKSRKNRGEHQETYSCIDWSHERSSKCVFSCA
jgi:hypothetical protein